MFYDYGLKESMQVKEIGKNIKRMRTELELTQSQIAETANITAVHLSHYPPRQTIF